jgi:hypothetical protein
VSEDTFLWRIEERRYAGGVDEYGDPIPGDRGPMEIRLFAVRVAKKTPKGWRLDGGKFVLASATKRWACPTIEEAFVSYDARKERQARIHQSRMMEALEAQNAAKRLKEKLVAGLPKEPTNWWSSHANSSGWLDGVRVEVKRHGVPELAEVSPR